MIISINQPAYLGWSGYFDRIARSDIHIVLDHVQFEKNSFVNRNRVLGKSGPFWLTVPVLTKGKFGSLSISQLEIDSTQPWKRKHLQSIKSAYGRSPYFDDYWGMIEEAISLNDTNLSDLCRGLTDCLLGALDIRVQQHQSSDFNFQGTKSDLVLEICMHFGATDYLSGPFGRDYLDLKSFEDAGIRVQFHDYTDLAYTQDSIEFIPNLSVIDLLFNEGASAAKRFNKDVD